MVMVTEIAPRATKQVEMIVDYPRASKVGVIMPDVYAPHASQMLVWSGLQNCCRIGGVKVWITNLLNKTIMLEQGERVAWWIPMEMERIQTAELAWQEAKRRLGSKRFGSSYALSKPTLTGRETQTLRQGDSDPLWCDDSHLSLNVDGVALLERDPLPNASLEDLRAFLLRLNEKIASSPDSEQLPGMYSQAARICVRIKGVKECQEDGEGELPEKMDFSKHYNHLTPAELRRVKEMVASEATFFMKGAYPKIIKSRNPVVIDTRGAAPRHSGYRRLSEQEQTIVNEYVEKLLAADVVEPCSGPWSSPILLVPKQDGGLRAVADLRKVNECAARDSYPMPDVQESLDQMAGAVWFSKIDLGSAFWQLPLAEESRDCTAFLTKTHGLLRWKALPMGFRNSSAYFQREIDLALGGLRFECCVAYIDDIGVYSMLDLGDHLSKVKAVIRALRLAGFSGNPAKCVFAQRELVFLGHLVKDGRVLPLDDKVGELLKRDRPRSLTRLREFLGLASYYRRFIKNFAQIAHPLTSLTKQPRSGKSKKQMKEEAAGQWPDDVWTEEHTRAFEALKGTCIKPGVDVAEKGFTLEVSHRCIESGSGCGVESNS
jgi:hypothetical protein